MHNRAQISARDHAINLGAMRRYFMADSTGGSIVMPQSGPDLLPRIRDLVRTDPLRAVSRSATTGELLKCDMFATISLDETFPAIQSAFVFVQSPPVAVSPASVLDMVRDAFGLNVSETADVFHVTRQTVYQWMKLADMEQVRSHAGRERIKLLYRAAQFWQAQPRLKGRWLRAILPSGITVLDLLIADKIDFDALQVAYATLTASSKGRRQEEGERATKAAVALAGAFAGLGSGRKARKGVR